MDILGDYPLEHALLVYEELSPIKKYERAIQIIEEHDDADEFAYHGDCVHYRTNTLRVLIDAGKLSESELERISKVDEFILEAKWLPDAFIPLKTWLRRVEEV